VYIHVESPSSGVKHGSALLNHLKVLFSQVNYGKPPHLLNSHHQEHVQRLKKQAAMAAMATTMSFSAAFHTQSSAFSGTSERGWPVFLSPGLCGNAFFGLMY
jgi:hypothetical protein